MIKRNAASFALLASVLAIPPIAHAQSAAGGISAFDTPASAPAAASATPRFEFARIRSAVPVGDKIGFVSSGMFCIGHREVRATAKLEEINNTQAVIAFKSESVAQGLVTPAAELSAFDAPTAQAQADYRIGGVLQSVSLDECADGVDHKGSVDITVKWEVFAPKLQKVVLTKVIPGSTRADSWEKINGRDFEARAYNDSLRKLFNDPEFKALRAIEGAAVATPTAATAAAAPLAALHLKATAAPNGGSQTNAPTLRQAVVTVQRDTVSGSGFYIADGYLLTNRHVVGTAHYVKIKLASGRTVVGEVLRDDARRDVALVKTEPVGVQPLHVSVAEPPVGEDVFAIGSPLGQDLAGTFTRGVLSGTREIDGLEYFQSDVSINHGNSGGPLLDANATVIALTVAKIDKAAGLSFFIPLRDAANALQIVFD
jgi:S1-C subfamily serine protease